MDSTFKFLHIHIAIQPLWTRLSPPWELGDDCVQPPVLTHPCSQWDRTGVKIHSTASAAWISGLCHFRCRVTTFPSSFIPKPEFSNLFLFVQKIPFQLGDRRVWRGSLLSLLYLGRCWVLQPEMAEQGGGISVSPNSSESGHGKQAVPSALQQCLLQAGSPLEDGAHNMESAQQSESPGCSP